MDKPTRHLASSLPGLPFHTLLREQEVAQVVGVLHKDKALRR